MRPGFFPRKTFAAFALSAAASVAAAQGSPAGLWKTFDEDDGTPKSLIRIRETNGVFEGRIERVLDPESPPDAICDRCGDDRRNQPLLGLTVIRGVRMHDLLGGTILDPENGKVYSLKLTLSADGKRLEVRGYVGTPLLGRTQTWQRLE